MAAVLDRAKISLVSNLRAVVDTILSFARIWTVDNDGGYVQHSALGKLHAHGSVAMHSAGQMQLHAGNKEDSINQGTCTELKN